MSHLVRADERLAAEVCHNPPELLRVERVQPLQTEEACAGSNRCAAVITRTKGAVYAATFLARSSCRMTSVE